MGKGKRNRVADALRKRQNAKTPNGSTTTMTPLPDELELPDVCPEIGDIVLVHPQTMLIGAQILPVSVFVTSVRQNCLISGWGMLDPELCLEQVGNRVVMKQTPFVPFHNLPYSSACEPNRWCWFDDLPLADNDDDGTPQEAEAEAEADDTPPTPLIVLR